MKLSNMYVQDILEDGATGSVELTAAGDVDVSVAAAAGSPTGVTTVLSRRRAGETVYRPVESYGGMLERYVRAAGTWQWKLDVTANGSGAGIDVLIELGWKNP